MIITGAIGDFLALGFGSQSLMTAIGGASTLAANVGISHFWLKETVSWLDITGVGCIITGAVIVCVYTPGSSPNQDLHSLLENSGSPQFALYMATVGVFIAVLVASIANTSFYKWRKRLINIVMRPLIRQVEEIYSREDELLQRLLEMEEAYILLESRVWVQERSAEAVEGQAPKRGLRPASLSGVGAVRDTAEQRRLALEKRAQRRVDTRRRRGSRALQLGVDGAIAA